MGSFGNIAVLDRSKSIGTKFYAEEPYPEGLDSTKLALGSYDFFHLKLEMKREESFEQLEVESLFNLIRKRVKADKDERWITIWMRYDRYTQNFDFFAELEPYFIDSVLEFLPQASLRIQGSMSATIPPADNNYANWPGSSPLCESLEVDVTFGLGAQLRNEEAADIISIPDDHEIGILVRSRSVEKVFYFSWEIAIVWSRAPIKLTGDKLASILYGSESTKDVTIVVGSGDGIKCHGVILAAHSPVFSGMMSAKNGMKESQTGIIEMKENSENGIKLLLQFSYGKVIPSGDLSPEIALELFELAHMYKLSELEDAMKNLFHEKSAKWFTPDMILEMYFYVSKLLGYKKLQMYSLKIMKRMTANELRSCNRYQGLTPEEKEELHWKLFEVKK